MSNRSERPGPKTQTKTRQNQNPLLNLYFVWFSFLWFWTPKDRTRTELGSDRTWKGFLKLRPHSPRLRTVLVQVTVLALKVPALHVSLVSIYWLPESGSVGFLVLDDKVVLIFCVSEPDFLKASNWRNKHY